MAEYTPTTGEIRYRVENDWEPYGDGSFDRWLAQHDREVAEKAWDEGYRNGYRQHAEGEDGPRFTNPYRQKEADDDR